MSKTGFLYDDIFLRHKTPKWHPESPDRLRSIVDHLRRSEIWRQLAHISPRKAAFEDIEAVHTKRYVERMKTYSGYADPDTYVSEDSLDAALFAAGAALEAVDRCKKGEINNAFCAVRPPGHHAEADRAMGFCIFNNVAVGARYAQKAGYKKVFIVDFDVHHGNGTQHIFEKDPSVFYFSTHQYPHYPGTGGSSERGAGNVLNIPMASGSGDREYMDIYRGLLHDAVKGFVPDFLFVSAGYDIHAKDPLSGTRVSTEGIKGIVAEILSSANVPRVFCLEGGYDLGALSESVLVTLEKLISF